MRQAGFGRQEGAVEVNGEHPFPFAKGEVLDRVHDLNAGVADQHVDGAELRDGGINAAVDGLLVGHVHGEANRFGSGVADLLGRRLRLL